MCVVILYSFTLDTHKSIQFTSMSYCVLVVVCVSLFQAVQQVVTNLQIGHIELRSEDSFDIQRFVHERRVEKIVVPLEGDILEIKNNFLSVHFLVSKLVIFRIHVHCMYL